MKRNLFLSIMMLTAISTTIVGMNNNNNQIQEEAEIINTAIGLSGDDGDDNDSQEPIIDIEKERTPKTTIFTGLKNCAINVFNISTNKLSKMFGITNIANDPEKKVQDILDKVGNITTLENFKADYQNHYSTSEALIKNEPSFIQKIIARKNVIDIVITQSIYNIHTSGNNEYKALEELNKKIKLKQEYDKTFDELIKTQISKLNEDFHEKSSRIPMINNNNNEDKSDKEQK